MIMNNVFFSVNNGLTSTTANHYANIAKELVKSKQEKLASVKFYSTFIETIEGANKKQLTIGNKELNYIEQYLVDIANMNSFCAWVREAIKEKDNAILKLKNMSLGEWKEIPDEPECPNYVQDITDIDVINTWNIEKRNRFFTLEAFAATYGKYIHPDGEFSKARKMLHKIENNPITRDGSGRDTVLYISQATIPSHVVDNYFMNLQSQYREYEKELNCMKAEIKEMVNNANIVQQNEYQEKLNAYKAAQKEWQTEIDRISSEFAKWKLAEQERISKLKIVMPRELEEVFQTIKASSNTKVAG